MPLNQAQSSSDWLHSSTSTQRNAAQPARIPTPSRQIARSAAAEAARIGATKQAARAVARAAAFTVHAKQLDKQSILTCAQNPDLTTAAPLPRVPLAAPSLPSSNPLRNRLQMVPLTARRPQLAIPSPIVSQKPPIVGYRVTGNGWTSVNSQAGTRASNKLYHK